MYVIFKVIRSLQLCSLSRPGGTAFLLLALFGVLGIGLLATPIPGLLSDSEQNKLINRFGPGILKKINAWQTTLDIQHTASEWGQLNLVNAFFNKVPYMSDKQHWGEEDYWATPAELLASNGGDCEDFAIAKLFTLLAGNVPANKLRLMYATSRGQPHMVLIYNESPDSVPLVLDNLTNEILSADQRDDLIPIFSFNNHGLWLAYSHGLGEKLLDKSGSELWEALLARLDPTGASSAQ